MYVCEIPKFMSDYLKKVELTGNREVYFIFTSGGYTGIPELPVEAIEYGNITQEKRRYLLKKYIYVLK